MISYPQPRFEQQRSEVLQRFNIFSNAGSAEANQTANIVRLAFDVPMVLVSLNQRYRSWFCARAGIAPGTEGAIEDFCSLGQLSRTSFVVADAAREHYFADQPVVQGKPGIRFFAGAPLLNSVGQRFGTLCLMDTKPRSFAEREVTLLTGMAIMISNEICLRSAGRYAVQDLVEAEQDRCDLYNLATTDELTDALNRRSFFYLSKREIRRCKRQHSPISVIMLDIDHFKRVNDVHGHAVGDDVIAKLAKVVSSLIRDHDIFGRLGGEEFGLVLPDTTLHAAISIAERIRNAAAALLLSTDAGTLKITISLGVDEYGSNDSGIEEALDRADQALYRAKRNGRNRVEFAIPSVSAASCRSGDTLQV
ncbi:MAG: sensor domain-containing diguanylate cyclase [Pseudomonadota bacterium]